MDSRTGSALTAQEDPREPGTEYEQARGEHCKSRRASRHRAHIVQDDVAHANPHVGEQRAEEYARGKAYCGTCDPGTPRAERVRRVETEMRNQVHDEDEHVDGARALHQPCGQPRDAHPHSSAAIANAAIARPVTFTSHALCRATDNREPTSMSLRR